MDCIQNKIEEGVQRFKEKLESGYFIPRNHHKPRNEEEIRVKIAEEVEEKMMYMGTCLNERDIILDIILGKRIPRDLHCNTDCKNDECKLYKNMGGSVGGGYE